MNADIPPSARYRVSLHRTRGCWFARVIDIPGCVARGASQVEAIENVRAMIRAHAWVAAALAEDPAALVLEINA
jgi:predicted RNase H-like HicB family nuclease